MNNPPKSRRDSLVIQELDGEVMVYDLNENKALCLNQTSALIWQLCDGQNTPTEISKKLSEKLGSKANEDLVWFALEQLKKENLIENGNELTSPFLGMNRREIIKKVGLGTMIALPIIASLVAPMGVHAGSCISLQGTGCTAAPNTCCPNTPILNCNTDGVNMRCCIAAGTIANGTLNGTATSTMNCGQTTNAERDTFCDAQRGPTCCSSNAAWNSASGTGGSNPCVFDCVCVA